EEHAAGIAKALTWRAEGVVVIAISFDRNAALFAKRIPGDLVRILARHVHEEAPRGTDTPRSRGIVREPRVALVVSCKIDEGSSHGAKRQGAAFVRVVSPEVDKKTAKGPEGRSVDDGDGVRRAR